MSKRRPKPIRKFWYIQDCGTYSNQLPVFVGYERAEIVDTLRKAKGLKPKAIQAISSALEEDTPAIEKGAAGSLLFADGYMLMRLTEFEDSWNCLDTVMHECFHATMHVGICKNLINWTDDKLEDEALAYLHEYLFTAIRTKLQDEYWRKGRKSH